MTRVTGQVRLPYGAHQGTGATGCVNFTQGTLGSRQGAIFVPGSISTPIKDGVMEPVDLTPGIWKVVVTVDSRAHGLPDVLVEGDEIALTATDLPADGTYLLTLEKNQVITHTGDGTYEIGEING